VPLDPWLAVAAFAGGAFGVCGAAGELLQRVFYAHAEPHLDPPAASVVVTTGLIAGFALLGPLGGVDPDAVNRLSPRDRVPIVWTVAGDPVLGAGGRPSGNHPTLLVLY
jgi:hypothetical protein